MPSSEPARAPPTSLTRSPTRNGRVLRSTRPANRLPSVCWAARPTMTAVNAPPTASVLACSPAIRSATTTTATMVTRGIRNPTTPAVPGSMRPNSAGPSPRPSERASHHPRITRAATVPIGAYVHKPGKSVPRLAKTIMTPAMSAPSTTTVPRARLASWRSTSAPSPTCRQSSVRDSKAVRARRNRPKPNICDQIPVPRARTRLRCVFSVTRMHREIPRRTRIYTPRLTGQSTTGEGLMEMRAAAIQLNSTADKGRNLETAERLVREAAADGSELIVLPEKWNVLGDAEVLHEGAEPLGGPTLTAAASWARDLGIHLVAGSIPERVEGQSKLFNTSALIGPDGELHARYRKIHMFDVDVGGVSYRESENEEPGDEIVAAAVGGSLPEVTLGMTVCYDLRFPELYRILAVRGATVLSVPSAFTFETGKDHWEVLLRARAIENQAFVIAPNQVGKAPPHYHSYGHSMIVDPWGEVLAVAPEGERFVAADLDLGVEERVRATLPSLANRRPGAYRWPEAMSQEVRAVPEEVRR